MQLFPHICSAKTFPSQFQPAPFWSWNDHLDPAELRWQIQQMHQAGIGGFFMHARGGLKTAYLSKEWLECIAACLDEAGKLGMQAYLYDENGWPSGFGGGLVNNLGLDYQQKYLTSQWVDAKEFSPKAETVAIYHSSTLERLPDNRIPEDYTGSVYHVFYEVNPFYVDNLDPAVVAKFIEVTHQYYYENLPKELLKHLRGIFTDEPQLSRRGMLWSFILEKEYCLSYQEDLLDVLPHLFLDTEKSPAIRIKFWKLITHLFAENFLKQIYDWCNAHNWILTGHHVLEELYSFQIPSNGSIMYQYQYYHIPGMDHLSNQEPDVPCMMQLVSAAAQTGKQQILSESFALTGWNFNFFGMQWMYQNQMAHGINFLCQHLFGYSLKGMRKRDYPGSWSYQQPGFEYFKMLNDRFSRVGMLLAGGEMCPDVLVYHTISSGWIHYNGTDHDNFLNLYGDSLRQLSHYLDAYHIQYHYGDEQLLEQYGSFTDGKLIVGKMRYSNVILPQLNNISSSFLKQLKQLEAHGGNIIVVQNQIEATPMLVDGLPPTEEERTFLDRLPKVDNELAAASLLASRINRVEIQESGSEALQILCGIRRYENLDEHSGCLYYLVNRRSQSSCQATITLPGGNFAAQIDQDNGNWQILPSRKTPAGKLEIDWNFPPAGSLLLFAAESGATPEESIPLPDRNSLTPLPLDNFWTVTDGENYLTIDRCEFQVDDGEWEYNDVSVIHFRLLQLERECKLKMKFSFFCDDSFDLSTPLTLVVEDPQNFTFALNEQSFEAVDQGYCFDRSFRRILLPPPRRGNNTLLLTMRYRQSPEVYAAIRRAKEFETEYNKLVYDMEVESIYLAGKFGVSSRGLCTLANRRVIWNNALAVGAGLLPRAERHSGDFVLSAWPEKVEISNLIRQGFPFFAGKLTLQHEVTLTEEQARKICGLDLTFQGANLLEVSINSTCLGVSFQPTDRLYGKGLFRAGNNIIELKLTQSLRNLLGPHHLQEGESGQVSTLSFSKEPNSIAGWPAPAYDENYCFVQTGISRIALLLEG